MRLIAILVVGLAALFGGCDIWYFSDLARARRISYLAIPSDAKITLVDSPTTGGPRFSGRTEIVVELSAEAYATIEKEAITKGYLPIDATIDTLFLGERVGPDGLYLRDPPVNGPEKGFWTTVVLDAKAHRILMRHTTS